jgi:hypothetical protein
MMLFLTPGLLFLFPLKLDSFPRTAYEGPPVLVLSSIKKALISTKL